MENHNWGRWLGVTDGVDKDVQVGRLYELLADAHSEITALQSELVRLETSMVANSSEPVVIERIEISKRRRIANLIKDVRRGRVKVSEIPRKLGWIVLKAPRIVDVETKTLGPAKFQGRKSSRFAGDAVLRNALEDGRYIDAYIWGRALFPKHGNNKNFVQLVEKSAAKRGNISQSVALANYKASQGWVGQAAARVAQGRLNDLVSFPTLPEQKIPMGDRVMNRVLHLAKESVPYHSNGFCARSISNLLVESESGFEPVVLTEPGFPGSAEWNGSDSDEVQGIEHHRLLPAADGKTKALALDEFNQLYAQLALEKVLSLKPSIIHASSGRRGYETAKVGVALSKATGIPLVYEVRSFFEGTWTAEIDYEADGEMFARRLQAEYECALAADQVITICQSMKDELISWGINPEKILVAPNGVDIDKFSPQSKNKGLAQRLGLKSEFTVGYVSNLDHARESQETLVEATALLRRRGVDVSCLLVGKGPRREGILTLAERLGIADYVVAPGSVPHEEVGDYYRLIDIFVVPRRAERAAELVTPLKPFEAMACGIPVVASDLPALREIVCPPSRGQVFKERSAEDLADTLFTMMSNPTELRTLGENGRTWVVEERQWSNNASVYKEAYSRAQRKKGNWS
ncbi:glycosyltransferase family 4 protein [Corynebacterium aurimucosum]|uniref:glycosyltransferase family 4 protein n=1 Tax=Corynebacterium aurimucosum TaxID=169292 RepID=UPI001879DEAD|nr:glycosyltransferase family 4 protein [Corynebacterium aurimucosum]MBE7340234.1 glycosyltransferase [Corynebacterium aurimucosum]